MTDKAKSKLEHFRKALPGMEKDVADFKRLMALARQAPFAAANIDFLDRMKVEWDHRESQVEFTKIIVKVCESESKSS